MTHRKNTSIGETNYSNEKYQPVLKSDFKNQF